MIQEIASHKAFDGKVSYYKHISKTCDTEMKFSVYEPPSIKSENESPRPRSTSPSPNA